MNSTTYEAVRLLRVQLICETTLAQRRVKIMMPAQYNKQLKSWL
jgi:hypothetical protein